MADRRERPMDDHKPQETITRAGIADLISASVPLFHSSPDFTQIEYLLTDDEGSLHQYAMASQLVRHLSR